MILEYLTLSGIALEIIRSPLCVLGGVEGLLDAALLLKIVLI